MIEIRGISSFPALPCVARPAITRTETTQNMTGCGFGAFAPPIQLAYGRFAARRDVIGNKLI